MIFARTHKKHSYLLLLVATFVLLSGVSMAVTSKTFLKPRPILQDPFLQRTLNWQFTSEDKHHDLFGLAATIFYQESTNDKDLARYFFPNNKTVLSIHNDFAAQGPADIWGQWVWIEGKEDPNNLGTSLNFASNIKIKPEHKTFGFVIQGFKKFDVVKPLFFSFDIPCVQVEQNLKFSEFDVQNAAVTLNQLINVAVEDGKNVLNATQAFDNPRWNYAKIKNGTQKLAGIADIDLKLGFDVLDSSKGNIKVFASGIIPTGYKPKMQYLFEPLVGNGRHWGIGGGVDATWAFYEYKHVSWLLFGHLDAHYLFEAHELRTYDLISRGQWSRYLSVQDPDTVKQTGAGPITVGAIYPAANYTTLHTVVTPGAMMNALIGLSFEYKNFALEAGYNLWMRENEKLSLRDDGPKVVYLAQGNNHEQYQISQDATLTGLDYSVPIEKDDIDINSAKCPSLVTNNIFVKLDCLAKYHNNPLKFYGGGEYDFSQSNRSIDKWGIFGGIEIGI